MLNHIHRPPSRRVPVAGRFILVMVLVAASAAGAAEPIQAFDPSAVHFSRLDNGLRVVVKEDHSWPVVAVNVVIRAGSARETAENNGIAHCLEHLIFRGARSAEGDSLSEPIEAAGGTVNGGTLRDYTSFMAVAPAPYLGMVLDRLANAIIKPTLRVADITAEKIILTHEARQLADQPASVVWDAAFRLAYEGHPYALPISGSEASLSGISAGALTAFHQQWYTANNASVVIVGDVTPERALAAVAQACAAWPAGEPPPDLPPVPALETAREAVTYRELPRATVLMGFRTVGTSNAREVCAVDLLLTILSEGYTSRLDQALLQGHLADAVEANFLTQKLPGLLGIRAECPTERATVVRNVIEQEVTGLQSEPVAEADLARAQRRLTRGFVFAAETFEGQAALLGFYEAIATYEYALTYLDMVRGLSSADVQAAAKAYLVPSRAVWAAVMPQATAGSNSAPKAESGG
jgi:zinc protease